jgi:hypothetical protein
MSEKEKNDERYADPQADQDPRTSDTGRMSEGSSDLNADAGLLPQDVAGVRRGDEDTPHPPRTPASENKDLSGDVLSGAGDENRTNAI